jgi:hypothetical protein
VGFVWWLYSTTRAWREKGQEEARSGALRLLLKLLRDAPNQRIDLQDLFAQFQSGENAKLRRLYCGRRWKFKSFQHFEGAIYRLHFEGKVHFLSATKVTFVTERSYDGWRQFIPTDGDTKAVMDVFSSMFRDANDYAFGFADIAEAAMRLDSVECTRIVHEHLNGPDEKVKRRAAMLVGRLVRESPALTTAPKKSA